jgi:ubiquinone/menaquinone biosynthesis C-methylase UbiE
VLIDLAGLQPTHRVLEIGCGTGTLLVAIARQHPRVALTGLDPDPKALARAKRKADRASVALQLDRGFADSLPYENASFDRVFSCFMFHHLADGGERLRTLREAKRVLKENGRLELLDFTQPNARSGAASRWIHSSHRLSDNTDDRVLSLMAEAGFAGAELLRHGRMFFAVRTAYYQARV